MRRSDERCLVRSGLVHLLDKLCSLANHRHDSAPADAQNAKQRVSLMAWAGFQVLSNRCVAWELEDSTCHALHTVSWFSKCTPTSTAKSYHYLVHFYMLVGWREVCVYVCMPVYTVRVKVRTAQIIQWKTVYFQGCASINHYINCMLFFEVKSFIT